MAAALALFSGAACSRTIRLPVELGALELELAFLVTEGADGRLRESSPVFGTGAEEPWVLPHADYGEGERALLVALPLEALARVGAFDGARARELELVLAAPRTPEPYLEGLSTPAFRRAPLPASAQVFVLSSGRPEEDPAEATRLAGRVHLRVPVDLAECQPPLGEFTDVGGGPDVFAPLGLDRSPNVRALLRLDPRRLVGTSERVAFSLEEGRAVQAVPLTLALPHPDPEIDLRDVALARTGSSAARLYALFAVGAPRADLVASYLVEVDVAGGALGPASWRSTPAPCEAVTADPAGGALLGCLDGALYQAPPGGGFVPAGRLEVAPGEQVLELHTTGHDRYPLVAASKAKLHLRDEQQGRWTVQLILQDGLASGEPLDFNDLAGGTGEGGELELWAAAQRGQLFYKRGADDWRLARLDLPPRFFGCAAQDGQTARLVLQRSLVRLTLARQWVHLVAVSCDAVIHVRRADHCAGISPWNGEITVAEDYPRALLGEEAGLLVGGLAGRLRRAAFTR